MRKYLFLIAVLLLAIGIRELNGQNRPAGAVLEDLEKVRDKADEARRALKQKADQTVQCLTPEGAEEIGQTLSDLLERLKKLEEEYASGNKNEYRRQIAEWIKEYQQQKKEEQKKWGRHTQSTRDRAQREYNQDRQQWQANMESEAGFVAGAIDDKEDQRREEFREIGRIAENKGDEAVAGLSRTLEGFYNEIGKGEKNLEQAKKNVEQAKENLDNAKTDEEKQKAREEVDKQEGIAAGIGKALDQNRQGAATVENQVQNAARNSGGYSSQLDRINTLDALIAMLRVRYADLMIQELQNMLRDLGKYLRELEERIRQMINDSKTLAQTVAEKKKAAADRDQQKLDKGMSDLKKLAGASFIEIPAAGGPRWSIVFTGNLAWPDASSNNDYIDWVNDRFNGNINTIRTTLGGAFTALYRPHRLLGAGAGYEYTTVKSDGTILNPAEPLARLNHEQVISAHAISGVAAFNITPNAQRFDLFAVAGAGPRFVRFEEQENGFSVSGNATVFGWQGGLLANYRFSPNTGAALSAGYRNLVVDQFKDADGEVLRYVAGYGNRDIQTNLSGFGLAVGLSLNF